MNRNKIFVCKFIYTHFVYKPEQKVFFQDWFDFQLSPYKTKADVHSTHSDQREVGNLVCNFRTRPYFQNKCRYRNLNIK